MIREFEFFHGSVFARIIHDSKRPLSASPFVVSSNSSYIINSSVGIYIKYSTKRMTPWRFTFKKEHQDELLDMRRKFEKTFLILVCNTDGIVCLSYKELKQILDEHHDPVEWVCANRRHHEMYAVKGSSGRLEFKIGANEFPAKLFT